MATHDVDETVLTLIGSGQADTSKRASHHQRCRPLCLASSKPGSSRKRNTLCPRVGGAHAASSLPTVPEPSLSSSWEPTTASSP